MEVRFFAPGRWSRNLDFVESIFGNAGDPYLPENDAGLDVEHWTGHTGCVILAPHLTESEEERRWACRTGSRPPSGSSATGMCWKNEDENVQRRQRVQDHLPHDATA